ncbi:MAG: phosphopentomutase [Gammaproteobacteria bacterium]|nr:phosphopentomutase [Gammaproteobacteria bacterium]
MSRSIILVLDSLGIGASADAEKYGDAGADTFGHIVEACAAGEADSDQRQGPLCIPNLSRWGLVAAAEGSRGKSLPIASAAAIIGAYGHAKELSYGKDTPSGHWEICGLPVPFAWGVFPQKQDSFPAELMQKLCVQAGLLGTLGNCHASGTEVIKEFGEQHILTGMPICYTSADSVFQIAAHEQSFGLQRLYDLCEIAKPLMDELNVTRVIARPFTGTTPADFKRTANRRDLTTPPIEETLLDYIQAAQMPVVSIGKIGDIFAHQGVDRVVKGHNNMALMDALLEEMKTFYKGLLFVNLVDFDSLYGHRRDVAGYAWALEELDKRLPEFEQMLVPGDLVLATADHGCDPTMPGSDHTREHVPVVFIGPDVKTTNLGQRETFADMGQTIAAHLGLSPLKVGVACQTI